MVALKSEGGTVVVYSPSAGRIDMPFLGAVVSNPLLRPILVFTMPKAAKRDAQQGIEEWVKSGNAAFASAARFDLTEVVAAHGCVERGEKLDHVLVTID